MQPELIFHLRSLSRFVYFVTEEEDRFLVRLKETLHKYVSRTWVFNAAFGLQPLDNIIRDWKSRAHQEDTETTSIHNALIKMYKDDPKEEQNYYVITDPERWLVDPHVQRRVLNLAHQLNNDIQTVKVIIFVGQRKVIPEKLSRYIEVVQDTGLTADEIGQIVGEPCGHLSVAVPENLDTMFKGLTGYEVNSAIAQTFVRTKKDPEGPRLEPSMIADFRRRQLKKTDLVQYIDTSKCTFDEVGGNNRFKTWAKKTKAVWTPEGAKFGLKHPKGVLAVGVWGTGKSLSAKTLGAEWGLPVVQLEMGRLRSSGVGETESNTYRALRIIENASPCIVYLDEAEKSLAGGQSSGASDAGTTSRAIGILSTWIQETTAKVCLAMTANSLKTLPVEFVNRMDERFFFDLPSEEDRIDIIKIHLLKCSQDPTMFNLAELAEKSKDMVGREIEQAITAAMTESFNQGKAHLDQDILANELNTKPRIVQTMEDEINEIVSWVGFNERINDGIRAKYASEPRNRS